MRWQQYRAAPLAAYAQCAFAAKSNQNRPLAALPSACFCNFAVLRRFCRLRGKTAASLRLLRFGGAAFLLRACRGVPGGCRPRRARAAEKSKKI